MARHVLSLEIPEVFNQCLIRVIDSSIYDPLVPIDCPTLQVTPPGFTIPVDITSLTPGFTENLTACTLGIQISNCDNWLNNLSDGVYVFRYSVSPNDKVYVEYNYLRITTALNRYYKLLCCMDIAACEPNQIVTANLRELQQIRTLLDAAKAMVEYNHQPVHGMNMLKFVNEKLSKLARCCNCQC